MKKSEDNSKEFSNALRDFTFDVAGGAAIRHLADLEYTVPEIKSKLDFPISEQQIGQAVWKHFVDKGIILTKDPQDNRDNMRTRYVACKGQYGRTYFKQVKEENLEYEAYNYVKCDFGKLIYKDKNAFIKQLDVLEKRDREYMLYMPWPLYPVWHIKNERFIRIMKGLNLD